MAIYNNNGQYGLFNLQDTPENVSNSGYGETYYGKSRAFDQADREQALRDVEYSKRDVEGNVIEPDFAEGYGAGTDRIDYDPAFGTLNSFRRFQPAPYTGQRPFANLVDLPSNLNYLSNSPPSLERILDKNKMFNRFELNSETPQVENYPTEPQNLGFIEPATVPKEAIYQDRIMNNNLSNSNYEPKQGILQGLQDKMGGLRDFLPGGDKSLSGMAVKGIKGIGNSLSGGLGNIFQDRQLYDDTTDEYGNVYSADELNSQNALGGYYTDAARSARRRTSRIANMLSRQKAGKDIGENNLAKLQAQEKIVKQQQQDKQNKIQKAATKRTYSLQDLQNSSDRGTGQNYAAARSRTSSRVSPSGRMRAYGLKDGGLASMFTRRR